MLKCVPHNVVMCSCLQKMRYYFVNTFPTAICLLNTTCLVWRNLGNNFRPRSSTFQHDNFPKMSPWNRPIHWIKSSSTKKTASSILLSRLFCELPYVVISSLPRVVSLRGRTVGSSWNKGPYFIHLLNIFRTNKVIIMLCIWHILWVIGFFYGQGDLKIRHKITEIR